MLTPTTLVFITALALILLSLMVAALWINVYKLHERMRALESTGYVHDHHWHYIVKGDGNLMSLRVCCHCGRVLLMVKQREKPRTLEHGAFVQFEELGG